MIRYVVTTFAGTNTAHLAREGCWGGMAYPSGPAAREAARLDAGDAPFTIRQESSKRGRG